MKFDYGELTSHEKVMKVDLAHNIEVRTMLNIVFIQLISIIRLLKIDFEKIKLKYEHLKAELKHTIPRFPVQNQSSC